MLLVAEGAANRSYDQLKQALHLPDDLTESQSLYKNIENLLSINSSGIELAVNQAIVTHSKYHLQPDYINTLVNQYAAHFLSVDFQKQNEAAKTINDYLSERTNGQIPNTINPNDLSGTTLLLTSSILFKGQWKVSIIFDNLHFNPIFFFQIFVFFSQFPFDIKKTLPRPFFRENGELIGDVPMMKQVSYLRNAYIEPLKSTIVELPYGDRNDDRFSMLLILPHARLSAAFRALRTFDIANIFKAFPTDENDFEEIILTVPKFEINSNFNANTELEQLGVTDVFNPNEADLSKMFSNRTQQPYLSHVIQKARIQVHELGTIAAAVTVVSCSSRGLIDEIIFDRPFGFLITDQLTNAILFAGQVKNPVG